MNSGKASPLHMAVQSGDLDMIKMCLDNGAQLDLLEVTVQIPPVELFMFYLPKCPTALSQLIWIDVTSCYSRKSRTRDSLKF